MENFQAIIMKPHKFTILLVLGILLSGCADSRHRPEKNPAAGTFSERFYIPPQERSILEEKARKGVPLAARRLMLHYSIIKGDKIQALQWAETGAGNGDSACRSFIKNTPTLP